MRKLTMFVAFLAIMSGAAFAQDVDEIIGKMKGAKKLTAEVRLLGEDGKWSDPLFEIAAEWNDKGDLTSQSGLSTDTYGYTYDGKDRKTSVVKKDGRGVLQSKKAYVYADDSSYTVSEEEFGGDKPGKETVSRTSTSRYSAKGKVLSRDIKDQLVGKMSESYTYDGNDRLVRMKTTYDGGFETKSYTNDARGNPVEIVVKDSEGKTTGREVREWDDHNFEKLRMEYGGNGALIRKMGMVQQYNERGLPKEMLLTIYDETEPEKARAKVKVGVEYQYYPKKEEKK